MKKLAFLFLLCAIMVGCKTRKQIEYVDREVIKYVTQVRHDTLREHTTDSVYLEVIQKGDTVYKNKTKEVIRWRDRFVVQHDTCWRDSIRTEYKEKVKEVKYIPKVYKISMGISILLLIFALIKIGLWLKTKQII